MVVSPQTLTTHGMTPNPLTHTEPVTGRTGYRGSSIIALYRPCHGGVYRLLHGANSRSPPLHTHTT